MSRAFLGFVLLGLVGWTPCPTDAVAAPTRVVIRYGVFIKERSTFDPWRLVAKYNTLTDAEVRLTLMMRHGGQYAVQIFTVRDVVPSFSQLRATQVVIVPKK